MTRKRMVKTAKVEVNALIGRSEQIFEQIAKMKDAGDKNWIPHYGAYKGMIEKIREYQAHINNDTFKRRKDGSVVWYESAKTNKKKARQEIRRMKIEDN